MLQKDQMTAKLLCFSSILLSGLSFWVFLPQPSRAQDSNFGQVGVEPGKRAVVKGSTGGTTSLPAVVGNVDRDRNKCLGFGDPKPDHIVQLKGQFSTITFKVESNGQDTTLVVMAPNGDLRCGDDTGSKKDAVIRDSDLKAGSYKVWVGSAEPGAQINYRLMIQGN
ncbi:MAG: hypothetical protein VKJ24_13795 [Synechococcales bacterium]|nr:hypothetical protein [Synechococcales bacterium]